MNQKGIAHLFLIFILLAGIAIAVYLTQYTQVFKPKASENNLYPIEQVTIDTQSTQSGTYSSHNQKVVSGKHGIFIAYIHSTDPKTAESNWRLMRSTDQGQTFSIVYESTNGTTPPAIETDDGGNIFLVHSDYKTGQVFFYRLAASLNFQNPKITKVPNMGSIGKFTTEIDVKRRLIYYFSQYNKFIAFDYGGGIRKNFNLTRNGPRAVMQYPYMYLDSSGDLYTAWTNFNYPTLKNSLGNDTVYRTIHFIVSKDGGGSWQKSDGQPLTLPITVDETGPSHLVSVLPEEYGGLWLSSFIVKNGKAHFVYKVSNALTIDPPQIREDRMHYVRFDLSTGQIDKNIYPEFKGSNIKLNWRNGYFVSGTDQDLYYVSRAGSSLALLKSSDNGDTWQDYSLGDYSSRGINHITGQPHLTADNKIIGVFTDQDLSHPSRPYSVKFFQINTLPGVSASPSQLPAPSPSASLIPSAVPSPSEDVLASPTPNPVDPQNCSSDADCSLGNPVNSYVPLHFLQFVEAFADLCKAL